MTTTQTLQSAQSAERSAVSGLLPLFCIIFISFLCVGIPLPALPLHVHGVLGFSAMTVGWVVGIQALTTIFSRRFAGAFCDRHGAKRSVFCGLPMAALSGVLYLVSTQIPNETASLVVLFLGRALMGPAESMFMTGTMIWGIGRIGVHRTGKVMAWQGIAMFAAFGLGAPIGIAIQQHVGFVGIAVVTIVLPLIGLAMATFLPAIAPLGSKGGGLPMREVLRLIWRYGMSLALGGMPFAIITTFLVLLYASQNWSGAGLAILAFSVGYVGVRLFFAHLPDRIGGIKVGAISIAIEMCGQLLLWQAGDAVTAGLGTFLTGVGFSLVFPAMGVESMANVPPHSRGVAVATFMAFVDLAGGFTGPIVGVLIGVAGYSSAFLAGAVACALGLILMMTAKRR
jgi:MFS family permease